MTEIVLNEKQWVEEALESGRLGSKPSETLGRLARYYYGMGYKKTEISRMLEEFMIRCDPTINIVRWQPVIDYSVKNADKYAMINIQSIPITKEEINRIKVLPGVLWQRLMFTLLCLAKYGDAINQRNSGWVNREAREIFSLANVAVTIKRQALLFNDLWRLGYITYSNIVDNINVSVNIISPITNEAEVAMNVTDFRNLGNQYMMHVGDGYMTCQNCGLIIKKTSTRRKYCPNCAIDIHIQKTIENRRSNAA